MASESRQEDLTEMERKTLILHALFPHLSYRDAFDHVGLSDYRDRQEGARSLQQKGFLQNETVLTPKGWELLAKTVDGRILQSCFDSWTRTLQAVKEERDREIAKWNPLRPYLSEIQKEPEVAYINIQAPREVASFCLDYLRLARLCIVVGAWGGAVQYCSLAVEHVLVAVLVSRGLRKAYDEFPALQELNGEFGKQVPEVGGLTKRLVSLIANFRNDAVHPRDHTLKPGQYQARDAYELTLRFLSEVRNEWFVPTAKVP